MSRLAIMLALSGILVVLIYWIVHGKQETILLLKRSFYLFTMISIIIMGIFLFSVKEVVSVFHWVRDFFN